MTLHKTSVHKRERFACMLKNMPFFIEKNVRLIKQWGITIGAYLSSTYILDCIAIMAGVGLVAILNIFASDILAQLDLQHAIIFLVLTYAIWSIGMYSNLKANWRLLEKTGISTNVFSKIGYDIAQSFTRNQTTHKIVSGAGYILTELGKEIPYYIGAFGVSTVSQNISLVESLVFLGGANLGAAVYEYVLAKGTFGILGLLSKKQRPIAYASFETEWAPAAYLREYYKTVEPDEAATIQFFVKEMEHIAPCEKILFFGSGPTLHHVFLTTPKAKEIHLADYLPGNIAEIQKWLHRENGSHSWNPFVTYTLACEGVNNPTPEMIDTRNEETRKKITTLFSNTNAGKHDPLGEEWRGKYQVVFSPFCADSITTDKKSWEAYMRNIASLVVPGGHFFVAALKDCKQYTVGGKIFPCANINSKDMQRVLALDFKEEDMVIIEKDDLDECKPLGYTGIILAHAIKKI